MDYIPYPVTRRPGRQQAEYKPKPGEIDLGTTYNQDFYPYEVQPFVPSRPKARAHHMNAQPVTIPTYTGNDTLGQLGHVMLSEHTVSEYLLNNWSIYEATSSICC